jgi:Cu2+-exporting ATPase
MVGINGRVAGLIHFRRSARLELAPVFRQLRIKRNLGVGIVSDRPHRDLGPLAAGLDVDFHLASQSIEDRIRFLEQNRRHGFKVAYVGSRGIDQRIASLAHVAISLIGEETPETDHDRAPVWLFETRLGRLAAFWDIADIHQRRIAQSHRFALVPNLFCVAGAFAWGFTSLASAVITNVGTYGVYSHTKASIKSLERQVAAPLIRRPYIARAKH